MRLLIASSNRGKLREIQAVLAGLPVELVLPADLGLSIQVDETGATYAENAALKARAYCQVSGLLTLADDSGLEVDALKGAPGLHSARFSPKPGASDADRRALLIRTLSNIPVPPGAPGWPARFHCTVSVAEPSGTLHTTEGRCDGFIITEERGQNGFGYDPIFFIPVEDATMAELPDGRKNQISHRARALQAALPLLHNLIAV
ncbi:MAG: non-canonical purine NTP pyrophosphatase, RdgB/HAM1 family [Chloroflexi bacterium GWB2_54_36]|nr:MAG: non-canonical purine NTP pyrophosphatase, RdgB/HAM1 family [Chloroflexi bacterium GWB2_54_36]HBA90571.1 non-canonical purine NTP pyrophosphatase, RdgB/HAM1 family [Anaerolineaceae bacterium]